jgi:hypothetical protein
MRRIDCESASGPFRPICQPELELSVLTLDRRSKMGGRGETVSYTKKFYKQALTESEKKQLIADITSIITNSTSELTIIAFAKEED